MVPMVEWALIKDCGEHHARLRPSIGEPWSLSWVEWLFYDLRGLTKGCPAVEQIPASRPTGQSSLLSRGLGLAVVKGLKERSHKTPREQALVLNFSDFIGMAGNVRLAKDSKSTVQLRV